MERKRRSRVFYKEINSINTTTGILKLNDVIMYRNKNIRITKIYENIYFNGGDNINNKYLIYTDGELIHDFDWINNNLKIIN